MTKILFLITLLLVCTLSWAQFTTVSGGPIVDSHSNVYSNGQITATLVFNSCSPDQVTFTGGGIVVPTSASVGLSATGTFTNLTLADNTLLNCTATKWAFTVCSAPIALFSPPVCFSVPAITISGATQSIT